MKYKALFFMILAGIAFYCFITAFAAQRYESENDPPEVRIITPRNNSAFQWNTTMNYAIRISDKEDGTSEYNEIPGGEVLLKIVYLPDSSNIKKYLGDNEHNANREPPGLSLLKTFECFTCHGSKNKLTGPSFDLIAKRYPTNTTSIEMLTNKLIKGSSGVWGNKPMPAHPDLKPYQAREIIRWVLDNNRNPDITYLTGIQGAFRTKQKPAGEAGKAVYILAASYTDHGLKGLPQSGKRGEDIIILKNYQ
jgi:cytochrome c